MAYTMRNLLGLGGRLQSEGSLRDECAHGITSTNGLNLCCSEFGGPGTSSTKESSIFLHFELVIDDPKGWYGVIGGKLLGNLYCNFL